MIGQPVKPSMFVGIWIVILSMELCVINSAANSLMTSNQMSIIGLKFGLMHEKTYTFNTIVIDVRNNVH